MKNLKRNAALVAAVAVIGAVGVGGVMTAQADSSGGNTPGKSGTEQPGTETNDDATDTGPDADPNEPGHQDAGDAGDGDGDGETAD